MQFQFVARLQRLDHGRPVRFVLNPTMPVLGEHRKGLTANHGCHRQKREEAEVIASRVVAEVLSSDLAGSSHDDQLDGGDGNDQLAGGDRASALAGAAAGRHPQRGHGRGSMQGVRRLRCFRAHQPMKQRRCQQGARQLREHVARHISGANA